MLRYLKKKRKSLRRNGKPISETDRSIAQDRISGPSNGRITPGDLASQDPRNENQSSNLREGYPEILPSEVNLRH
jgi:hypothetical protein